MFPSSGPQPYTLQALRLGVVSTPAAGTQYYLRVRDNVGFCSIVDSSTYTAPQTALRNSGEAVVVSTVAAGRCRSMSLEVRDVLTGETISISYAAVDNL